VLALLTKYLLQYKKVSIPHIGTFELVQQPPQLQVAEKLVTAPSFTTRFTRADNVPEQQFKLLASTTQYEQVRLQQDLLSFGEKLRSKIKRESFQWSGFGTLRYRPGELVFEPENLMLESLQAVPASKVIRQNAQHQVLVGDREMTSQQASDTLIRTEGKRSLWVVTGWIVFILALAAIVFILYRNGFQTSASGLKTNAMGY
jgi:hypothetical protein